MSVSSAQASRRPIALFPTAVGPTNTTRGRNAKTDSDSRIMKYHSLSLCAVEHASQFVGRQPERHATAVRTRHDEAFPQPILHQLLDLGKGHSPTRTHGSMTGEGRQNGL